MLQIRPPSQQSHVVSPLSFPPSKHHACNQIVCPLLFNTSIPVCGTLWIFCLSSIQFLQWVFYLFMYLFILFVYAVCGYISNRVLGKGRKIWDRKCRPWRRLSKSWPRVWITQNGSKETVERCASDEEDAQGHGLLAEWWVVGAIDVFLCVFSGVLVITLWDCPTHDVYSFRLSWKRFIKTS